MLNAMHNAAAAMRAHTRGLMVSAQNTANALTDGYQSRTQILQEDSHGGVSGHVETRESLDAVDLAQETVQQISSEKAIQANLEVLRTSDKMLGVLIDIVG